MIQLNTHEGSTVSIAKDWIKVVQDIRHLNEPNANAMVVTQDGTKYWTKETHEDIMEKLT